MVVERLRHSKSEPTNCARELIAAYIRHQVVIPWVVVPEVLDGEVRGTVLRVDLVVSNL